VWVGKACEKAWYGNDYGGFYVCPSAVPQGAVVYSFGIGKDISFDSEMMQRHGAQVFAFDPTPDSIAWVGAQQAGEAFHFYPFGISHQTEQVDFFLPKNPAHVSGSALPTMLTDETRKITVQMRSFADIVGELGHTHIDVLKMDIEGAEYSVIPAILQTQASITQLLIEFHGRVLKHQQTVEAVALLRAHGYEVFGISPRGEEISFIKKT
jgi:FkbM family methyltransferase